MKNRANIFSCVVLVAFFLGASLSGQSDDRYLEGQRVDPPPHFVGKERKMDPYQPYYEEGLPEGVEQGEYYWEDLDSEEYEDDFYDLQYQIDNPNEIHVVAVDKTMSRGTRAGWQVLIIGGSKDAVTKRWMKLMKTYGGKVKRSKGPYNEVHASRARIAQLTKYQLDVYATAESIHEGTRLTVFFDKGGDYIAAGNNELHDDTIYEMLHSFAVNERKQVLQGDIETAEKEFDELQKELNGLVQDTVKLVRRIEDSKDSIVESQDELADLAVRMDLIQEQIEFVEDGVAEMERIRDRFKDKSRDNIDYLDARAELDRRKKELDRLRSRRKGLLGNINKQQGNIEKSRRNIVKANNEISQKVLERENKAEEVHNQALVLEELYARQDSVH